MVLDHDGYHYREHPNRDTHIVKHSNPDQWVLWISDSVGYRPGHYWIVTEAGWGESFPMGDLFYSCKDKLLAERAALHFGVEIELCWCAK